MNKIELITIDTKEVIDVYSDVEEAIVRACEMRKNGDFNIELRTHYEETQENDDRAADAA
jgi:hypothetical protein